jgi:hypothetical protein
MFLPQKHRLPTRTQPRRFPINRDEDDTSLASTKGISRFPSATNAQINEVVRALGHHHASMVVR